MVFFRRKSSEPVASKHGTISKKTTMTYQKTGIRNNIFYELGTLEFAILLTVSYGLTPCLIRAWRKFDLHRKEKGPGYVFPADLSFFRLPTRASSSRDAPGYLFRYAATAGSCRSVQRAQFQTRLPFDPDAHWPRLSSLQG
jgi:hypothetical protein